MKIRKCKICNKEFHSYYGREVCSSECEKERKYLQDKKGNEKRRAGRPGEAEEKVCPTCGETFAGLNRKYCSHDCYSDARRKMSIENLRELYRDADWRREHIKKVSKRQKEKRLAKS